MSSLSLIELSSLGMGALVALVTLNWIWLDLSVTSSWGKVSLTSCTSSNGTHVMPYPSQTLYLQPSLGFCQISNTLETKTTQCTLWSNDNFWATWDAATASNGAAKISAAKTFPSIYALLCIMCFLAACNFVAVLVPLVRPSLLSRRAAQLLTVCAQALLFILMVAGLSGDLTTPLTEPKNWSEYYLVQFKVSCGERVYDPLVGTLWASLALVSSLFIVLLGTLNGRVAACVGSSSPAIDSDLTDSLTKAGPSDAPSINSEAFASPIV